MNYFPRMKHTSLRQELEDKIKDESISLDGSEDDASGSTKKYKNKGIRNYLMQDVFGKK